MPTTTPEEAVRNYLTFLADPESLVDAAAVARLEKEVAAAKDPIDKLKAVAALHAAQATDPETFERGFVQQAQAWAAEQNIPATAFQQMGVPSSVLQAAGIIIVSGRPRARSAARPASTTRRPSMKADELEAAIVALDEPFSIKDVSEKIGGSTATVKAAIDRLEAQGKVVSAGERSGGRGRASRLWTVAVEPL